MIKLRAQTWLAVSFLGAAASMVATSASANICQIFSDTWNETEYCHVLDAAGTGSTENGNKVLTVGPQSGNRAAARGHQSNGSQISGCVAIDDAADGTSVRDSSGCNGATHFVLQHQVW